MSKRISEEVQRRILEAHKLTLSQSEAAKYAGVNRTTVYNYWKAAGLKPHFEFSGPARLPKETQDLIHTAWILGLSANKAAIYSGTTLRTVLKYWNAAGLKSHYAQWPGGRLGLKVSLEILLDGVFDTVKNPNESLELAQIIERLKDRFDTERINTKYLQKKINQLVGWGYYNAVQKDGKTYYSAGMPAAMDGNLKASVASK